MMERNRDMKTLAYALLASLALSVPAYAHGYGSRVFFGSSFILATPYIPTVFVNAVPVLPAYYPVASTAVYGAATATYSQSMIDLEARLAVMEARLAVIQQPAPTVAYSVPAPAAYSSFSYAPAYAAYGTFAYASPEVFFRSRSFASVNVFAVRKRAFVDVNFSSFRGGVSSFRQSTVFRRGFLGKETFRQRTIIRLR